jgi:arsenate reductase
VAGPRVWSYSRCSTCRRALAWLEARGIVSTVVDITTTPPDRSLLVRAHKQFGQLQPLFNTSGQSYRALGAATVKAMSEQEALDALADDGKLVKRPFVELPDGRFLVGFKPEIWSEAFFAES